MELRFVIASLRKWWFVALLGGLAGALGAAALSGPREGQFQSTAVVAIRAPSSGASSPDREVAQQVAVLRSRAFKERVAGRISLNPNVIDAAVKISQQPATDLVDIVAVDVDRQRVRTIAQGMADEFIATEQRRDTALRQSRLDSLQDQMRSIETELRGLASLPPAEATSPDRVAQRTRKEQELREVREAMSELRLPAAEGVSEIVEPATISQPVPATRTQIMMLAGMLCGAALGLAMATVLGRFSRFVVDDVHASEVLQIPLAARVKLPAAQAYSTETPPRWAETDRDVVNVVTAQLQTMAALDAPLRVAVVAGQRGAGATAMALALAGSLRRTGDRVVLVDADDRNPELTKIGVERGRPSTDAASEGSELTTSPPSLGSANGDGTSDVLIAGRSGVLRREAVRALLARAAANADVVVADGGPLLDSAPAGELCHAADAVVFVVRRRGQRIDVLRTASMRLSDIRHKVLVVCVTLQQPTRRQRRRAARGAKRRKEIPVLLPPEAAGA